MGITESVIEDIKSRIDLAELISSYGIQVKHAGATAKACCPFHHEKTPSFNINSSKGFYHCFGCGESGDAIKFVQKQEGLTFVEAVKKLAEQCGVKIEEAEDPNAGLRKRLYSLMAELAAFYRRCLLQAKEGETARKYLESRALAGAVAYYAGVLLICFNRTWAVVLCVAITVGLRRYSLRFNVLSPTDVDLVPKVKESAREMYRQAIDEGMHRSKKITRRLARKKAHDHRFVLVHDHEEKKDSNK